MTWTHAQRTEYQRAYYQKHRERLRALRQTPGYRERKNARRRTHFSKYPEDRERRNALQRTPEFRAKERVRQRKRRAKIKANGSSLFAELSARNTNYKFKKMFRMHLRRQFKNALLGKIAGASELLGCTWDFAIKHFETLFQPGMTLANHGTVWEIDHRIPLSAFNPNDPVDQLRANHWTNLQPLFKADNSRKNNRFPPIDDDPDWHLFWPTKIFAQRPEG